MEHKIEITITDKISDENINDIISTAFEGGINYWCDDVKILKGTISDELKKDRFKSDLITLGATLVLFDAESDEKWKLTLKKVIKGITMHCSDKGILPSQLMEDYDANDADSIIQYALFDKQVFA
jgi:hypothetical protein